MIEALVVVVVWGSWLWLGASWVSLKAKADVATHRLQQRFSVKCPCCEKVLEVNAEKQIAVYVHGAGGR